MAYPSATSTTPASAAASRGRIPTPSRLVGSSIPTPGRSRAGSVVNASGPAYTPLESPGMTKALLEAIRANDPKQHRTNKMSENVSPNSSPTSQSNGLSFATSGRRSVAKSGPPSSINTTGSTSTRTAGSAPKTPITSTKPSYSFTPRASTSSNATSTSRPGSRQSDVRDIRSKPVKDSSFEPGDGVRIESLGMEGTLRYVGAIEGKPGVWAGVELAPGFAGRGKNDGTVNGVSYFNCAAKSGVFVAINKLSAPIRRPSSVASSRDGGRATPLLFGASTNGRATPALSNGGRVTPAMSANGRVTPARSISTSGRITPSSFGTPGVRPRQSIAAPGLTPAAKPRKSTVPDTSFTAGSRASKYLNMTAQELSSVKNAERSTTSTVANRANGKSPSPPRSTLPGSPFATPKAPSTSRPTIMGIPTPGVIKSRPSLGTYGHGGAGTPRSGRKTDMPPPSSPVSPTKRLLASSPSQGKLGLGFGASLTAASPSRRLVTPTSPSPRRLVTPTGSEYSVGGDDKDKIDHIADLEARNRELQERIAALTSGSNGGISPLSDTLLAAPSPSPPPPPSSTAFYNTALEEEKARTTAAQARISELETQVRFHERAVKERESRLESAGRDLKSKGEEIERVRAENEARIRELTSKLNDAEALVGNLRAAVEEVREGKKEETEAIVGAKDKEIELLNGKVARLVSEFEEERRELITQIEELRKAGQETIALYEEKLDGAETKRWEMEDRVREMEDKVRKQKRSMSPSTIVQHASEAAKIDNETLREQVTHLERKVNQLETQLEYARDSADKEEQAMRTRVAKYKDNETLLRRELMDVRTEVEGWKRTEAACKARIEELEEALRENAVALENARADIENLRAELNNLEGVQAGIATNAKADEEGLRRSAEKASFEEINQLKELLESSRVAKQEAVEQHQIVRQEAAQQVQDLKHTIETLEREKAELEQDLQKKVAELAAEHKANADSDRKSLHHEQSIIGNQRDSVLSNTSRSSREQGEEIAGLKYIIQELNRENAESTSRLKALELDKKALQEECDELREAMHILESNVNDELKQLDEESPLSAEDAQKSLKEARAKYEVELGQLRQKLKETEQKHARTVNELNKEVSELETLIESKIYREDELERELERYKDKLERASQRKHSKTNGDPVINNTSSAGVASGPPPTVPAPALGHQSKLSIDRTSEGEICEICEQPGHDIFTCDLLKGDMPSSNTRSSYTLSTTDSESSDLWCEDCETSGHTAADCPHSMEVF
ncbi:hypothetical protein Clacol_000726 [Clathrus columnatus]|uniref:CAP-Gly domain-containing protein n=1 Tax=Clathrus columnatus TaxID=1419009 RepID=A0AAV5A1D1_9AGAM|nr:hypothetical protein Clacol_000726 [Clathrus columnatus]